LKLFWHIIFCRFVPVNWKIRIVIDYCWSGAYYPELFAKVSYFCRKYFAEPKSEFRKNFREKMKSKTFVPKLIPILAPSTIKMCHPFVTLISLHNERMVYCAVRGHVVHLLKRSLSLGNSNMAVQHVLYNKWEKDSKTK
jgi:hypothetical protein